MKTKRLRLFPWYMLLGISITLLFPLRAPAQVSGNEESEAYTLQFSSHAYSSSNATNEAPALSWTELSNNQVDAAAYWKKFKRSGRKMDRSVLIQLYKIAGHFSVIHALLDSGTISAEDSGKIGAERARLHADTLDATSGTKKFGNKIGVNDFGSGELSGKSDVDFTLYPGDPDADGAELVGEYKEQFRKLADGMDPSAFDLVAHRHEATIPDWRQASSSSEFAAKLRKGTRLLKSNSEAYFLEGAYVDQIMARSVDPGRKTFTWVGQDENGNPVHTKMNVLETGLPFFYNPESGARYAFGITVGNWHFFHSHNHDKQGQAKYVVRSVNGAKTRFSGDHLGLGFEKMSTDAQSRLVHRMYGDMFDHLPPRVKRLKVQTLLATLQTAVKIRELKSKGITKIGVEALKPLIDLERANWPDSIPVDEDTLLKIAQSHLEHYWPKLLVENNIRTSTDRLLNWLAPDIEAGKKYNTLDKNGKPITIDATPETVKRFQYSAFFELKDAIGLMSQKQIDEIKKKNPKAARDIEILKGIYEHETIQHALNNSGNLPKPAVSLKERLQKFKSVQDMVEQERLKRGKGPAWKIPGRDTWNKLQVTETWMQERSVDLLYGVMGGRNLPALYDYRESVQRYNEGMVSPTALMAADYGTSFIRMLDAYVVEGEMNSKVWTSIGMELVSRAPVFGMLMNVSQNPGQTAIDLVSTQLIPGYGPLKVGVQFGVEAIRLGGHIIFVPLQRDKILLAYQGYLPPQEGGVFSSGQKERINSPRPPLLWPIDPGSKLSLEERRAKIYSYFKKIVVDETINRLPDFEFKENIVSEFYDEARSKPQDKFLQTAARGAAKAFMLKEREVLETRLRQYVLHWWNATGVFAEFDELIGQRTAGLPEAEFRKKLEAQLLKDYYKGKEIHIQKGIDADILLREKIIAEQAEIAAQGYGIREEYKSQAMRARFEQNGEAAIASALDGMPAVKPEIKLWAMPIISTETADDGGKKHIAADLTAWATVSASEKTHPQPWRIEWRTNQSTKLAAKGKSFSLDIQRLGELEGELKEVVISATAFDADGRKITETAVTIPLEKTGSDEAEKKGQETGDEENKTAVAATRFYRYQLTSTELDNESSQPIRYQKNATGYAFSEPGDDPETITATYCKSCPQIITIGKPATFSVVTHKRSNHRRKTLESKENRANKELRLSPPYNSSLALQLSALGQTIHTKASAYSYPYYEDLGLVSHIDCDSEQAEAIVAANEDMSFSCESRSYPGFPLRPQVDYSIDEKIQVKVRFEPSGPVVKNSNILTYRYEADVAEYKGNLPSEITSHKITRSFDHKALRAKDMVEADRQLQVRLGKLILNYRLVSGDSTEPSSGNNYTPPAELTGPPLAANPKYPRGYNPSLAGNTIPNPGRIAVPSILGLNMDQAESALKEKELIPQWVAGAPAPDKSKVGLVVKQTPAAGSLVNSGESISVEVYSENTPLAVMPDLTGMHIDAAEKALKNLGLTLALEVGDAANSKAQQYTVQSQSPAARKSVEEGSVAKLVVYSEFIPSTRVPDITGLTIDAASAKLKKQNLGLSLSIGDPAPTASASGTIQGQQPVAGKIVSPNENVTAVVYAEYIATNNTEVAAMPPDNQETPAVGGAASASSVIKIMPPEKDHSSGSLPLWKEFPKTITRDGRHWKTPGLNIRHAYFEYARNKPAGYFGIQTVDLYWQEKNDPLGENDRAILYAKAPWQMLKAGHLFKIKDELIFHSPKLMATVRMKQTKFFDPIWYNSYAKVAKSLFKQLEGHARPKVSKYSPMMNFRFPARLQELNANDNTRADQSRSKQHDYSYRPLYWSQSVKPIFTRKHSAYYYRLAGKPSNANGEAGLYGIPEGGLGPKSVSTSIDIYWLEEGDPINEHSKSFFIGRDTMVEDRQFVSSKKHYYYFYSSRVAAVVLFRVDENRGPQRLGALRNLAKDFFGQLEGHAIHPSLLNP